MGELQEKLGDGYVVVDVPEDLLWSDYEICHFPDCLCIGCQLFVQVSYTRRVIGDLLFQSPWK